MNEKTKEKILSLVPDLQKKANAFLPLATQYLRSIQTWKFCSCEVTEALRDIYYQAGLYQRGRRFNEFTSKWEVIDASKIVTNTLDKSMHLLGKAFDIAICNEKNHYLWPDPAYSENKALWIDLANIGRTCGLFPGAYWSKPDYPHYSLEKEV